VINKVRQSDTVKNTTQDGRNDETLIILHTILDFEFVIIDYIMCIKEWKQGVTQKRIGCINITEDYELIYAIDGYEEIDSRTLVKTCETQQIEVI